MPIITHIVCDGCQAVKKEVNHWYVLTTNKKGAQLQPLEMARHHHGHGEVLADLQYFCGRHCALKALGCWMDSLQKAIPARQGEARTPAETGTRFADATDNRGLEHRMFRYSL